MRLQALLFAATLLIALQLVSAFVHHAFAFGLLGVDVPPELAATVLPFFAPLILLPFRAGVPRGVSIACVALMGAARVALPWTHGGVAVIVGAIGVAAFLVWLPAQLHALAGTRAHALLGVSSALAMLAFIALRAAGGGIEPSTRGAGQIIGVVLAVGAVALMWRAPQPPGEAAAARMSFGRALLCAVALMGALCVGYFTFIAPNVIARWSAAPVSFSFVVAGLGGAAGTIALAYAGGASPRAHKWRIVVGAVALGAVLTAAAALNGVSYAAYPAEAPEPMTALTFPALLLWPLAAAALGHAGASLIAERPSLASLAGAFCIAGVLSFAFIAVQLLNTLYAYVPVVGPPLRDRYWLGVLLPSLAMALPLLAAGAHAAPAGGALGGDRTWLVVLAAALGLSAAVGPWLRQQAPAPSARRPLRVTTFNMQQGFSAAGRENLRGQLDALRALDADVIGLQESDTNRIGGGNEDAVGYFAAGLGMHSYYGPSNVAGTFGVALLSRHPIVEPVTKYIDTGEGEQVALVMATIASDPPLRVAVTHLGNCGPVAETRQILDILAAHPVDAVMGDFNFTRTGSDPSDAACTAPNDSHARFVAAGWRDALQVARPGDAGDHIDHVFVADVTVRSASLGAPGASDHPTLTVDLEKEARN